MIKKITKMALVCLAMLCMSSAQSPILTRPTVRVLFEDLELIAYPGHPITIDIYFTNTNNLYVWRDDTYTLTYINLEELEKRNIVKALQQSHNRRKLAAKSLGISERTLYRKIKDYGLED